MPSLKAFLHALIDNLVEYHDFQFSKDVYPKELLFEKPYSEIEKNIKELIEKILKKYKERENFLNYIFFIIKQIHPLVYDNKLLNSEEEKKIILILQKFILNCKKLLDYKKNQSIMVMYHDKRVNMIGFKLENSFYLGSKICKTGELLIKYIHINQDNMLQSSSFDQVDEKTIKKFAVMLIRNHQLPLNYFMLKTENIKYNESNIFLNEQMCNLQKKIELLEMENEKIKNKKNELSLTNITINKKIETTEICNSFLKNENKVLKERIIDLESNVYKLEEKSEKQAIKINEIELEYERKNQEVLSLKKNNAKYFSSENKIPFFQIKKSNIKANEIFYENEVEHN